METKEPLPFQKILIISTEAKYQKGLANGLVRFLDTPRFFALNPSSKALPGQKFDWSKADLLVVDFSELRSKLYQWFSDYPSKELLPPTIFVDRNATVDDAGKLFRAGATDYLELQGLKLNRLKLALQYAAKAVEQRRIEVERNTSAFAATAILSTMDTQPPGEQGSDSANNPETTPAADESAGMNELSGSFMNTGLMSLLDRNQVKQTATNPVNPNDSEDDFVNTGLISLLDKNQKNKTNKQIEASSSPGFTTDWPFTTNELEKGIAKLDGYHIVAHLGSGGTASIFKVSRESNGKIFAMKLFDKDSSDNQGKERFIRGYELLANLQNPHIISIEELVNTSKATYVILEYFSAGDLQQRLDREGVIPRDKVIQYALQIFEALNIAHNAGVLHRDLKPSNIMFRNDGSLALVDFGTALSVGENKERLTMVGQLIGTPHYVSPERAQGSELDHRSDLYAAGVILFEMTEGRLPYNGTSEIEILMAHVRADIPDLSNADDPLNGIIKKLLAKNPDGRYRTGQDVIEEILASAKTPIAASLN